MIRRFFEESGISINNFCISSILLINAFVWLSMSPAIIDGTLEVIDLVGMQEILVWLAYYGSIVVSSITGSILASRINRFKFIYAWIALGIATSVIPIFYSIFTWIDCLTISILLGASFGLGIPSCLSYFADITQVENRGKISGLILLAVYIVAPILALTFDILDLKTKLIIFSGWRLLGLIVAFFQPNEKILSSEKNLDNSFLGIIKNKTFGFYILAWIMFLLVDSTATPIVINSQGKISETVMIMNPILVTSTALIAGIIADWIGRKRIVLYGYISLGVAYAIIGIAPGDAIAGYFFVVINGITVGLLFVTFILILWGDISQPGSREKYYALGEIPFFLTSIIGLALNGFLVQIPETSIFSVAAFFLFLAVLPLLYAPETLPQKKIELRRLRKFAEDAKKAKEKYERKMKG